MCPVRKGSIFAFGRWFLLLTRLFVNLAFIPLLNKYLMSTYYVSHASLDSGNAMWTEQKSSLSWDLYSLAVTKITFWSRAFHSLLYTFTFMKDVQCVLVLGMHRLCQVALRRGVKPITLQRASEDQRPPIQEPLIHKHSLHANCVPYSLHGIWRSWKVNRKDEVLAITLKTYGNTGKRQS